MPCSFTVRAPTFCLFAYYGGLASNAWMNFGKWGVQSHTSIDTVAGWQADMVTSPLARHTLGPSGADTGTHTVNVHTNKHLHTGWMERRVHNPNQSLH